MSRHKGIYRKQTLTVEDLAELVEIHRRLQRMHSTLNHASIQQLPLMAASATVKAAWAELSGAGWAWAPGSRRRAVNVVRHKKRPHRREPAGPDHADRLKS